MERGAALIRLEGGGMDVAFLPSILSVYVILAFLRDGFLCCCFNANLFYNVENNGSSIFQGPFLFLKRSFQVFFS